MSLENWAAWLALAAALAIVALVAICWHFANQLVRPPRQQSKLTPADLSLDAETVEFAARDGVLLRGWWIPARRARGTIIFSHGYRGDSSTDLEYAAWLTGEGYNLLYFDHRAHGMSDGRYTTLGYLETRDLLGAIDFLKGRGIERVGVLGFSMGGSVALQTAPLTDAIVGVVVDCTFANLHRLILHHAPAFYTPWWFAPISTTLVMLIASLQTRCNLFAHSPEKSIPLISPRPVLLIQAGKDELVPPIETARLYAAACEPKELWMVADAIHRCVDDIVEEEYKQRVAEFFNQLFPDEGLMLTDAEPIISATRHPSPVISYYAR